MPFLVKLQTSVVLSRALFCTVPVFAFSQAFS